MNIAEIKTQIGLQSLTLVRQLNDDSTPTEWVSHWDNDKRIRVTMHEEVMNRVKADSNFGGLAVKKEEIPTKQATKDGKPVYEADGKTPKMIAAYTRFVVITPKNIEACF